MKKVKFGVVDSQGREEGVMAEREGAEEGTERQL